MNIEKLTFTLNQNEKIIINLHDINDEIYCCYLSQVSLLCNNQNIFIGKSIIIDLVETLSIKLKLALSSQLTLHHSIKKNIGYYWNQDLNEDNSNLFLIQGTEIKYWVGIHYLLWTTDSNKKDQRFATWLYNDKHDNIIFEVTPTYPETFIDPEDPAEVAAYKTWIKTSYKPFFTRIIPHEVAQQWLDQTNEILKVIENNE